MSGRLRLSNCGNWGNREPIEGGYHCGPRGHGGTGDRAVRVRASWPDQRQHGLRGRRRLHGVGMADEQRVSEDAQRCAGVRGSVERHGREPGSAGRQRPVQLGQRLRLHRSLHGSDGRELREARRQGDRKVGERLRVEQRHEPGELDHDRAGDERLCTSAAAVPDRGQRAGELEQLHRPRGRRCNRVVHGRRRLSGRQALARQLQGTGAGVRRRHRGSTDGAQLDHGRARRREPHADGAGAGLLLPGRLRLRRRDHAARPSG